MSYSEKDGQVVLTMSREDYDRLLMCLGTTAGVAIQGNGIMAPKVVFELVNRLNEGNPNFTPYQVEK